MAILPTISKENSATTSQKLKFLELWLGFLEISKNGNFYSKSTNFNEINIVSLMCLKNK